jgi:hypothetical protein
MLVYFLKLKSIVFNEFQNFKSLVENILVVTLPHLGFIVVWNYIPKNSIIFFLNAGLREN